jgi:hypothetical protein
MTTKISIVPLNISPEGFVFNPSTGESYTLNPTGLLIVQQLIQGSKKQKIVEILSKNFNMSKRHIERDVEYFVKELQELGIIK